MNRQYEINDKDSMMAKEPALSPAAISTTDALWTLIAQQTYSVQLAIKERIDQLLSSAQDPVAYSMEELHNRLDESELQMEQGDIISGDNIHDDIRSFINSLPV